MTALPKFQNNSVKNILSFFIILLVQIVLLAGFLIAIFKIPFNNVIQGNINETAKIIYIVCLYIFLVLDLILFDPNNFFDVLKISKKRIKYFLQGFILAFSSLFFLYFIESSFDFIEIKKFSFNFSLFFEILILSFFVAIIEELLFRNFIFRKLNEDFGLKKSLFISGYIYAQLHFLKLDQKLIEIILPLTGLFFIGIILAYCFINFDLWFSTGLHMAWVLLISYTTQADIFNVKNEYILLTGGLYPIAGVFGIIMSVLLLYLLSRIKRQQATGNRQ